uniref:hepatocyte nuclear factor 6-like n=1 Tax=Myxine glutinosa TaxID=7769 RepID=UPI00358E379D
MHRRRSGLEHVPPELLPGGHGVYEASGAQCDLSAPPRLPFVSALASMLDSSDYRSEPALVGPFHPALPSMVCDGSSAMGLSGAYTTLSPVQGSLGGGSSQAQHYPLGRPGVAFGREERGGPTMGAPYGLYGRDLGADPGMSPLARHSLIKSLNALPSTEQGFPTYAHSSDGMFNAGAYGPVHAAVLSRRDVHAGVSDLGSIKHGPHVLEAQVAAHGPFPDPAQLPGHAIQHQHHQHHPLQRLPGGQLSPRAVRHGDPTESHIGSAREHGTPCGAQQLEEINTREVAQLIMAELKRYSIPQAVFAQRVLGRSQGTLSDLLRNPKPWGKLKSGRETFRRMWKWLQEPEFHRIPALRLAACRRKEQDEGRKRSDGPKKPRLVFTDVQRRTLQAIFRENRRPAKEIQVAVAQQLGLQLSTVSNFFMNARRRCVDRWRDEVPSACFASESFSAYDTKDLAKAERDVQWRLLDPVCGTLEKRCALYTWNTLQLSSPQVTCKTDWPDSTRIICVVSDTKDLPTYGEVVGN